MRTLLYVRMTTNSLTHMRKMTLHEIVKMSFKSEYNQFDHRMLNSKNCSIIDTITARKIIICYHLTLTSIFTILFNQNVKHYNLRLRHISRSIPHLMCNRSAAVVEIILLSGAIVNNVVIIGNDEITICEWLWNFVIMIWYLF